MRFSESGRPSKEIKIDVSCIKSLVRLLFYERSAKL